VRDELNKYYLGGYLDSPHILRYIGLVDQDHTMTKIMMNSAMSHPNDTNNSSILGRPPQVLMTDSWAMEGIYCCHVQSPNDCMWIYLPRARLWMDTLWWTTGPRHLMASTSFHIPRGIPRCSQNCRHYPPIPNPPWSQPWPLFFFVTTLQCKITDMSSAHVIRSKILCTGRA
jgi:hypothetical protein